MTANSSNQNSFYLRALLSNRANYIVSKMAEEGCDYSTALLDAQQNWNGDAAKDYEGRDTVTSLSSLVEHCCGVKILPQEIFCRGIAFLSPLDFQMADYFGYAIKYLGLVRLQKGKLDVRMHATLIFKKNSLSLVGGAQVGIEWSDGHRGPDRQYGLYVNAVDSFLKVLPPGTIPKGLQSANVLDLNTKYYIRFTIQDSLDATASVTQTLSKHHIGIQHLHKQGQQPGSIVPLVIVTHEANEKNMRAALKEIDGMNFVTQMTKMIRIDENTG